MSGVSMSNNKWFFCPSRPDIHVKIYLFNVHVYLIVTAPRTHRFDNIYNLPLPISYHNVMSGMINLDGLKSPIMSDELNLLHINKISMLIRIY